MLENGFILNNEINNNNEIFLKNTLVLNEINDILSNKNLENKILYSIKKNDLLSFSLERKINNLDFRCIFYGAGHKYEQIDGFNNYEEFIISTYFKVDNTTGLIDKEDLLLAIDDLYNGYIRDFSGEKRKIINPNFDSKPKLNLDKEDTIDLIKHRNRDVSNIYYSNEVIINFLVKYRDDFDKDDLVSIFTHSSGLLGDYFNDYLIPIIFNKHKNEFTKDDTIFILSNSQLNESNLKPLLDILFNKHKNEFTEDDFRSILSNNSDNFSVFYDKYYIPNILENKNNELTDEDIFKIFDYPVKKIPESIYSYIYNKKDGLNSSFIFELAKRLDSNPQDNISEFLAKLFLQLKNESNTQLIGILIGDLISHNCATFLLKNINLFGTLKEEILIEFSKLNKGILIDIYIDKKNDIFHNVDVLETRSVMSSYHTNQIIDLSSDVLKKHIDFLKQFLNKNKDINFDHKLMKNENFLLEFYNFLENTFNIDTDQNKNSKEDWYKIILEKNNYIDFDKMDHLEIKNHKEIQSQQISKQQLFYKMTDSFKKLYEYNIINSLGNNVLSDENLFKQKLLDNHKKFGLYRTKENISDNTYTFEFFGGQKINLKEYELAVYLDWLDYLPSSDNVYNIDDLLIDDSISYIKHKEIYLNYFKNKIHNLENIQYAYHSLNMNFEFKTKRDMYLSQTKNNFEQSGIIVEYMLVSLLKEYIAGIVLPPGVSISIDKSPLFEDLEYKSDVIIQLKKDGKILRKKGIQLLLVDNKSSDDFENKRLELKKHQVLKITSNTDHFTDLEILPIYVDNFSQPNKAVKLWNASGKYTLSGPHKIFFNTDKQKEIINQSLSSILSF